MAVETSYQYHNNRIIIIIINVKIKFNIYFGLYFAYINFLKPIFLIFWDIVSYNLLKLSYQNIFFLTYKLINYKLSTFNYKLTKQTLSWTMRHIICMFWPKQIWYLRLFIKFFHTSNFFIISTKCWNFEYRGFWYLSHS